MFVVSMFASANAEAAVTGVGIAPANAVNAAQARIMARRAAVMNCYRQLNGKAIKILNEVWDGHAYKVTAE